MVIFCLTFFFPQCFDYIFDAVFGSVCFLLLSPCNSGDSYFGGYKNAFVFVAFFDIASRYKIQLFAEVDILARHTWYFYYVPLFLILLFLFNISLRVLPKRYGHTFGIQIVTAVFTAFFIILVLTNDIHQFIFKFKPVFSDWNNDYLCGGSYHFNKNAVYAVQKRMFGSF